MKLGVGVTVLEQAPRLMARGVGPVVSQFYARLRDGEEGVVIHTGAVVRGLEGKRVVCEHAQYDADLVVVGAGAVPNVELAREAGLAVEDGIVVDLEGRTSTLRSTPSATSPTGRCRSRPVSAWRERAQRPRTGQAGRSSICGRPAAGRRGALALVATSTT